MRLSEIREVIQLRQPEPDRVARRLRACLNVEDLRRLSRRRLPRAVFDYVDGGADEEITVRDNEAAFRAWKFAPRVLEGAGAPAIATELFGRPFAAPLMLCPTGYTRMMHPDGEEAVARATRDRRLPYALSTVGTTTIEDLAATGHEDLWFQLYVLRDRGLARSLVERAQLAGYRGLQVTVDTPVTGIRERDVRNGLTIPPELSPYTVADIAVHVGYWTGMLRSPPLRFANLGELKNGYERVTAANMASLFDPALTWDDLAEVRSWWKGPMVIKGWVGPEDARLARSMGIDGIHLSNHGGRQLDRAISTLDLVAPVREALGDEGTIVVDSGVRHGADIAIAVALGADMCGVGRPYLYGLSVAGERGVLHMVDLLMEQLRRTMHLAGVVSLGELRRQSSQLLRRAP
jgi:L-lactate dehydrogenase (cytochrome)